MNSKLSTLDAEPKYSPSTQTSQLLLQCKLISSSAKTQTVKYNYESLHNTSSHSAINTPALPCTHFSLFINIDFPKMTDGLQY